MSSSYAEEVNHFWNAIHKLNKNDSDPARRNLVEAFIENIFKRILGCNKSHSYFLGKETNVKNNLVVSECADIIVMTENIEKLPHYMDSTEKGEWRVEFNILDVLWSLLPDRSISVNDIDTRINRNWFQRCQKDFKGDIDVVLVKLTVTNIL